jgi:hypothetical protein
VCVKVNRCTRKQDESLAERNLSFPSLADPMAPTKRKGPGDAPGVAQISPEALSVFRPSLSVCVKVNRCTRKQDESLA